MKKGFTLIELLVVVLIIGVLSAIAVPQYNKIIAQVKLRKILTKFILINASLERATSLNGIPAPYSFSANDGTAPTQILDITVPTDNMYYYQETVSSTILLAYREYGKSWNLMVSMITDPSDKIINSAIYHINFQFGGQKENPVNMTNLTIILGDTHRPGNIVTCKDSPITKYCASFETVIKESLPWSVDTYTVL